MDVDFFLFAFFTLSAVDEIKTVSRADELELSFCSVVTAHGDSASAGTESAVSKWQTAKYNAISIGVL